MPEEDCLNWNRQLFLRCFDEKIDATRYRISYRKIVPVPWFECAFSSRCLTLDRVSRKWRHTFKAKSPTWAVHLSSAAEIQKPARWVFAFERKDFDESRCPGHGLLFVLPSRTAIRLFSSILSYAVDMELIERNPALGIKLPPGGQRHRYLSSDELRRLGEILEQPAPTATAGTAAIILRLLLLTGARRGEIEGLKWSEVDFNFGMLRKKTSKTGANPAALYRPETI